MSLAQFTCDYVKTKLESLCCPITEDYFCDPVYYTVNNVDQIFERSAIEQWRTQSDRCPLTNADISNVALRACSDEFIDDMRFIYRCFLDQNKQLKSESEIQRLLLKENSRQKKYIVKEFLRAVKSADVNRVNLFKPVITELIHETENGMLPLEWAISANHPSMVACLLNSGAKLKGKGNEEIILSCSKRLQDNIPQYNENIAIIIELLFKHGAQIDNEPNTASVLHVAIGNRYPIEILQLLLNAGVNINKQNKDGETSLHCAVRIKHNDLIVDYLLRNGADPTIKNNQGVTPREAIDVKEGKSCSAVYRKQFKETIAVLNYYESLPQFQNSNDKFRRKKQELENKIEQLEQQIAKEKRLKKEALEKEKSQFKQFEHNYLQSYNQANFFQRKAASMKGKLANNEITSMVDVEKYAKKYPDSRAAQVLMNQHRESMQSKFQHCVARGQRDEAEQLLKDNLGARFLLNAAKFTDYSNRTFHCTAYEYAYWAKDTYMRRMLEKYMDSEAKTAMLERIEAIKQNGLTYIQHGKKITGETHFDLIKLISALRTYLDRCDEWHTDKNWNALNNAWIKGIGMAQRDLPVHVMNEYLRMDRSFYPLPTFKEGDLPNEVVFSNHITGKWDYIYPLAPLGASAGLGLSFGLYGNEIINGGVGISPWFLIANNANSFSACRWLRSCALQDLAAMRCLYIVRTNELTQSYDFLQEAGASASLRL